jgi:hypothetical protein
LPAVFPPEHLTLKRGVPPQPLRLQAVPHVKVTARFIDQAGEPAPAAPVDVANRPLSGTGGDARDHEVEFLVPHGFDGLLAVRVPPQEAIRYRLAGSRALKGVPGNGQFSIGTLNEDATVEVVRYKAPVVTVKVIDEGGKPVQGDVIVSATYAWGSQPLYVSVSPPVKSDLRFRKAGLGQFHSTGLLPDEDVVIHARAAGYETGSENVRLAEGASTVLSITLKKAE